MATSKEEVEVKLDPHLQELYDKLEEEKKKNVQLQALQKENARLTEQINQLETEDSAYKEKDRSSGTAF